MYELVVIPKAWYHNADDQSKKNFTNLMNVAYSKAKYKYQVIETTRVKNYTTLASDFGIDNCLKIYTFLLLAPEAAVSGITRDFDAPVKSLEDSFSCDIPDEYLPRFSFDAATEVKVTMVDDKYQFGKSELNRSLGTMALKTETDHPITKGTVDFWFTGFVSYLRGLGPKLLELVTSRVLLNPKYFHLLFDIDLDVVGKILLSADCVKEHNLENYYLNKCGFRKQDKPDLFVKLGDLPWEEGLKAYRDFHICYIEKEIIVKA